MGREERAPLLHSRSPNRTASKGQCWDFSESSTSSAVFNLCASTLGAGVLSLPYAMHQAGLVVGVVAILAVALISSFSLQCLINATRETGYESYEELSAKLYGPTMLRVCQLSILLFGFGIIVAYVIVLGDVAEAVLHLFPPWVTRQMCMIVGWGCLMLPLSFFPSLGKFRFVSLVGVLSIVYLTFAVVAHSHESLQVARPPLRAFNWSGDILVAVSTLMFALTSHIQVPLIYKDLGTPTESTTNRVIVVTMLMITSMYTLEAVAGYAEFGEGVTPNILSLYASDHSPYISLAFLSVAASVIVAFPLNVFPCRFTLSHLLWNKSDTEIPSALSHLLTAVLASSALLIALCVPSVNIVFALTGSTVAAFICFILPGLFITRLKAFESTWFLVGAKCLVVFGVFAAVAGTFTTVIQL